MHGMSNLFVDRHSLELVEKKSWNQLRNWEWVGSYERSDNAVDGLASGLQVISPQAAISCYIHSRTRHLLPHPATAGRKKGPAAQPHPPPPTPAHGPLNHRYVFTIRRSRQHLSASVCQVRLN